MPNSTPNLASTSAGGLLCRLKRPKSRGLIKKTETNARDVRVILPSCPGDPYYVFMLLPQPTNILEEEYRNARRNYLEQYCIVVKAKYPDAEYIVGIAIDADMSRGVSEDLICIDVREWSEEAQNEALKIQQELKLLIDVRMTAGRIQEYPDVSMQPKQPRRYAPPSNETNGNGNKIYPNEQCPCGSGTKYKKCCGKR